MSIVPIRHFIDVFLCQRLPSMVEDVEGSKLIPRFKHVSRRYQQTTVIFLDLLLLPLLYIPEDHTALLHESTHVIHWHRRRTDGSHIIHPLRPIRIQAHPMNVQVMGGAPDWDASSTAVVLFSLLRTERINS
jgi:hypothetical protein